MDRVIKIIFIIAELAAICSVILIVWNWDSIEVEQSYKATFVTLFTLSAVTMQKEQGNYKWYNEEDEQ